MNEYSEELKKVFKNAEIEKIKLQDKYVESNHFILSLLKTNNEIRALLNECDIDYENYKKESINDKKDFENAVIYSPSFKKIIDNSNSFSKENKILINHVFLSILEDEDNIGVRILKRLGCEVNTLYLKVKKNTGNKNSSYLSEIGINLNTLSKEGKLEKTIGRDKEIKRIIEILCRKNKNNPLLVGDAGVGKTAIVHELASFIVNGKVPNKLKNIEIISISMSSLVAGTKYRGEFEERLGKIIKELESNPNIVIFIDEIHTLVGAGGAEGAIDASNILKPALARNNLKCIGATTLTEYKKYIEKDKALDRRFQKVYVEEPNTEETLYILKKIRKDYENFHKVKINNEILSLIPTLSKRYITDRKEPDRSIDILDEVCAKASVNVNDTFYEKLLKRKRKLEEKKKDFIKLEDYVTASKIKSEELEIEKLIKKENSIKKINNVTKEDLKKVLELKSNTLIIELSDKNYSYKKIKNNIKKKIIGQDKQIDKIIDIISNKELDLNKYKPLSLIFNGSTGVGKTETAKILAKELKYNLIKLDMSEFSSEISANKIVGSAHGYVGFDDVNTVFESVRDKPNSLIVLDEFDKAHSKVLNLFLNILDEGILRNSKNELINFKNCIFILTTNYLNKENNIGFNKTNKINYENYSKEFMNRVDEIIEFNDLKEKDIYKIINNLTKTIFIDKDITNDDIKEITNRSNYKVYGARKIKNLLINELRKKYVKN